MLERAGDGGHAAEAGLLGELAADLEVGVDARLDPPEQLQDQPIAVDERRVALFARHAAAAPGPPRRGRARRRAVCTAWIDAPLRLHLLLALERLEQRAREAIVEPGVEQDPLAGAGDRREHRVRRPFLEPRTSACALMVSGRK